MEGAHEKTSVAIVGMACRVAGADSTARLWENLVLSKDVQKENPRFSGFYSPEGGPKKGLTNVNQGYFIDNDVDKFDNAFFAIPPVEAGSMDPQQRMLLEVTYEAVENAGIPIERFMGTNTAVYTGMTWSDYNTSLSRDLDMTPKYMSTGGCNAIAANRVSYFFDLHGPSVVLDTACSSTMVGFHQAVQDLQSGQADMAVVNGSNLLLNPDVFVHMSELGFLSPSGRCRSFDAGGDGYVRAEGVIAMLLKPLDKAMADGDAIRAVIRGTRINQDGRTQGITQPSSDAQRANMEALYLRENIDPKEVQYFEAHGTGTAVGDPLELSAIDAVYRDSHLEQKLMVGSVKSNIGHLEAVAALAGIAKTVESLERGLIPPQMHFVTPNPKIDFTAIEIPRSLTSWPLSPDNTRRAAVNSFGFGGTNGHAVLEYTPRKVTDTNTYYARPYLFKVSASSQSSLKKMTEEYAQYVEVAKPQLQDIAYTLLSRRSTLKNTLFVTAATHEELAMELRRDDWMASIQPDRVVKNVAFIFTGQGAQWPSMGKQLIECSPLFRSVVLQCSAALKALPDAPSWDVIEELCRLKTDSRVYESSFSQPLCTILQIALVELWRSWGINPVAAVGHSSGEIAAAYCAGHLSLRDAVVIAYYRGMYLSGDSSKSNGKKGSMCAVGAGEAEALRLIRPHAGRLALACVNSPGSCTLSGDEDAIREVIQNAKDQGLFCRQLRVESAYHSHHMLPMAPVYRQAMTAAGVGPIDGRRTSICTMFSSVKGRNLDRGAYVPAYWEENMTSTVRFLAAVTAMLHSLEVDAMVEIGPHPALKGPTEDILASQNIDVLPYFWSCSRGQHDFISLLQNVGRMITSGMDICCDRVNAMESVEASGNVSHVHGTVLTDVPKYAWDHKVAFWGETELSWNYRHRMYPRHELLGSENPILNPQSRSWRNLLMLSQVSWLKNMTAIYILMALEAMKQASIRDSETIVLRDFVFHNDLPLDVFVSEETIVELHTHFDYDEEQDCSHLCIYAYAKGGRFDWQKMVSGVALYISSNAEEFQVPSILPEAEVREFAETFPLPKLDGIEELCYTANHAVGTVHKGKDEVAQYSIAPTTLDAILRLPQSMLFGSGTPRSFRLSSISFAQFALGQDPEEPSILNLRCSAPLNARVSSDVYLRKDYGAIPMYLQGVQYAASRDPMNHTPPISSLFFQQKQLFDITYCDNLGTAELHDVLELITHKWPMADIGIVGLGSHDVDAILSCLHGISPYERSRFRSATIVGEYQGPQYIRLRAVDRFNPGSKLHVLFGPWSVIEQYTSHLEHGGLVCIAPENHVAEHMSTPDAIFPISSTVRTTSGSEWLLGRPLQYSTEGPESSAHVKLFIPNGVEVSELDFGATETIKIDGLSAQELDPQLSPHEYDVIVLDCGERSILVDIPGDMLLPWIQSLLPRLRKLLWVSRQTALDPFNGLAASFVRTLCTEHPTLKAVSLVIQDEHDIGRIGATCRRVYDAMLHGENEVELLVKHGAIHALRHIPDDKLSASVGLALPVEALLSLSDPLVSHHVSCESPGQVSLLARTSTDSVLLKPGPGSIKVIVEASLVDYEDFLRIQAIQPYARSGLGLFFVGNVAASDSGAFVPGDRVFGWYPGAHASYLMLPADSATRLDPGGDAAKDLIRHACYTIAVCLLVHECRVRSGDRIRITHIPRDLQEALSHVAAQHHAFFTQKHEKVCDIDIIYDASRGLFANGRLVVLQMLLQRYGLPSLQCSHAALPLESGDTAFEAYPIDRYPAAFVTDVNSPGEHACFRVLLHFPSSAPTKALITYLKPKRLFRDDGSYVLIGGLGGVGRELLSWMVKNGAKHIVTVSRNGPDAPNAQEVIQEVEMLGGHLEVLRADASCLEELSRALHEVRKDHRILGCINLAILLDDSPVATMTSQQWDAPLQVKIKTSWNLHQSTLEDELDFFILFSSCVTMIGSRMQASYSTGNSFLNQLATYRRSLGLTAVSLLVPALTGFGVLHDQEFLLKYMQNAGYFVAERKHLYKLTEAAIQESRASGRAIIESGLQMFSTVDGKLQTKASQTQVFWAEFPEFGLLLDHKLGSDTERTDLSLAERLKLLEDTEARELLLDQFLQCLSSILGYNTSSFNPNSPIGAYGLDSLNAVACRYWFFKELALDISVFDVLGCKSIDDLVSRALSNFRQATHSIIPDPVHYEESARRPLSRSQSRLWFLHRYLSDKTANNLLLVCHIEGQADTVLLEKAWTMLTARHEVLRSRIEETPDGPQQVLVSDAPFHFDVSECSEDEYTAELKRLTAQAREHEFALENGELIHCWFLKSDVSSALLLGSHHLAWDRASSTIVFEEITAIYRCLVAGQDIDTVLPPVPYQFLDYTLWQEQCLKIPKFVDPLVDYWKEQLRGTPEAVSLLPFAKVDRRPTVKQLATDHVEFSISPELSGKIKEYCAENALTSFMFMTAAIGAVVRRLTGDADVLIGISDSDRGHSTFDKLIGFTVNMLAIRSRTSPEQLYRDYLQDFRQTCLDAYKHRSLPFDYLLQAIDVPRRTSHSPIFQITVNYQVHGAFREVDFGNFKFTRYGHYNARSQSDFSIDIEETQSGALEFNLEFDTALYDTKSMLLFAGVYQNLIQDVLATAGDKPLGELELVSPQDQKLMAAYLQPRVDSELIDRSRASLFDKFFEEHASALSARTALVDQTRSFSYAEIDSATATGAKFLLSQGARRGETIALLFEPGAEMVITVYSILRAGCAYLAINDVPDERLRVILEDVDVQRVVIDDNKHVSRSISCGLKRANILHVHEMWRQDDFVFHEKMTLSSPIQAHEPICCIFTSGSTGRPKGLYLTHGAVRLWHEGFHGLLGTSAEHRILLASALNFDMALVSVYGAICCGATLVVAPREAIYSPARMVDLVVDERVSSLTITPTQFLAMTSAPNSHKLSEWKSLRTLVLGGEAITQRTMMAFFNLGLPQAALWNGYGPSEATLCVSLRKLEASDCLSASAPLSGPIFPASFHLVDPQGNSVPFGVPGELLIGGPTLCSGYINRPELTTEKFVHKSPFSASTPRIAEGIFYCSGDSFRLDPDGTLHYMGRVGGDRQVKIRGQRTELGEIEGAIWQALDSADGLLPVDIQNVAVVYRKQAELVVAYLAASALDDQHDEQSLEEVRRYLRSSLQPVLPTHMRPGAYVLVSRLPMMVSGKTDYRTIAGWPTPISDNAGSKTNGDGFVPLGPIQQAIASIWRQATGIEAVITPTDDFFSVGGHSLALMQVQSAILDKFGVTLSLADMFSEPTLEGTERLILEHQKTSSNGQHGVANGTKKPNGIDGANPVVVGDQQKLGRIDWHVETTLPADFVQITNSKSTIPPTCIALTGASTIIGAYFIHLVLTTTGLKIMCLGERGENGDAAKQAVIETLKRCRLIEYLAPAALDRIVVFPGELTHPTLSLSPEDIAVLDREVHAIYNLSSDVSLFGNYSKLRAGNLGVVRFLISLARGNIGNTKPLHHLSTWATVHLQSWLDTTTTQKQTGSSLPDGDGSPTGYVLDERELAHIQPGTRDGSLAYLKVRWACEAILHAAAHGGLPVSIIRSSMCAMAPNAGVPLPRSDINRRIILGSLRTGLVPDFGSERGGGMSWVTFDFLAAALKHLTLTRRLEDCGGDGGEHESAAAAGGGDSCARIWHIVPRTHISYRELAKLLENGLDGHPLRVVAPEVWFAALRAEGGAEMKMHAEVLDKWWRAGWVPFGIDAQKTLDVLEREADLKPVDVTRDFLLKAVVGDDEF
ncbi:uncharacterized protein BCR38DRAFT_413069 [Pseudomassariella vexata]|uniref:Polyketide synthase n=1 Tax=Pseudomassariella vexata TaxID=1141098 RepID=A0A1Y2DHP7_9PEZI|nr:uncharacterized protein BCR38DRAFT_413069 [Pseudomassariella vexata]ORY58750.1 hypothetical protein BCR38DRAFT_413069 [Pseudomassariella vexata]